MLRPSASLRKVNHTWSSSGTRACADVSLDLHPGTVHALLGENGAGKTSLGHILAGVVKPDSGTLIRNGSSIALNAAPAGPNPGIGLVRQRSSWPPNLELWEAAILGREGRPTRRSRWLELFAETARRWNLGGLDPRRPASGLNAETLQRGQLVAALMFDPDVVILDEPAASWEEGRSEEFFRLLEELKNRNTAVLLVTHRIDDALQAAEFVTVLRRGRAVLSDRRRDLTREEVARGMFGDGAISREATAAGVEPASAPAETTGNRGDGDSPRLPRLSCRDLGLVNAGRRELAGAAFDAFPGEIVAIAGLREEGLAALEDLLTGHVEASSGAVLLNGRPVKGGTSGLRGAGLRYVPSDAAERGISLRSTVAENLLILESRYLARKGWLAPGRVRRWADRQQAAGNIVGRSEQRMHELSGGNMQKVILQRELAGESEILLAADPTRGLDERSRLRIHKRLIDLAAGGAAVILLASDLDEALAISHRMAVVSRGRLSPVRRTGEWTRRAAAALIAGSASAALGSRP